MSRVRSPPPAPLRNRLSPGLGHFASPKRTHRRSRNCCTHTAGRPRGSRRSCARPRRCCTGRAVRASHCSGPPMASGTAPPRSPRAGSCDERIPGQYRPLHGSSAGAARQPSTHRRLGWSSAGCSPAARAPASPSARIERRTPHLGQRHRGGHESRIATPQPRERSRAASGCSPSARSPGTTRWWSSPSR